MKPWAEHDSRIVSSVITPSTPLEYALLYASRGWPVLPSHTMLEHGGCSCGQVHCKTPGKHPRTQHGVSEATTGAAQIRAWWRAWPDANIGIACGQTSGLLVVDVDPRHGGDITLEEIEATHGELPRGAVVETGGGGLHIYLIHPPLAVAGKLGTGIDIKSDGGYAIAPPSKHALGPIYGWYDDTDETLGATPGAAPAWLCQRLARESMPKQSGPRESFTPPDVPMSEHELDEIMAALPFIDADDRENWLTVGMALHAVGAGKQGWMLWEEWSRQSDKYDQVDQARVWRSFRHDKSTEITLGSLFHLARQSGWTPDIQVDDPAPIPAPTSATTPATPKHLLTIPGVLGEMVDWINETSPQRQPLFAVQAALALGSVVASRIYATDWENYTSSFFACIGQSGAGKEYGRTAIRKVLEAAEQESLLGPRNYTSGAAVFTSLYRNPCHIAMIDELGHVFESQKNDSHKASVNTELLSVWGTCDGVIMNNAHSEGAIIQKEAAEGAENKPAASVKAKVYRPGLSIFGTTTPDSFYDALSDSSIKSGLLSRFIIVSSDEPERVTRPKKASAPPQSVVDWVSKMRRPDAKEPGGPCYYDDPMTNFEPIRLSITEDAARVYDQAKAYEIETKERLRQKGGPSELANRWAEHACKLAELIALSNDPRRRLIREEDIQWAVDYVQHYGHLFVDQAQKYLGLSEHAKLVDELTELLENYPKGMTKRELARASRSFRSLKPFEKDQVLSSLLNYSAVRDGKRKGHRGPPAKILVHASLYDEEKHGDKRDH